MKLLFVHRKPRPYGNFSLESIYQVLTPLLEQQLSVNTWQAPAYSNGFWPRLNCLLSLRAYTKSKGADVVHVTGDVHFLLWGIAKGKRILTIHDIGFLHGKKGLKRAVLDYFWLSGPIQKAHAVTCVSEATQSEILAVCPAAAGKLHVIPTIIDARFVRVDKPFHAARPTLLLLGSAPNKNLQRVLRATQGLDVHLSLVAELGAAERALLQGQSHEVCSRISFEALLQKYQKADVVVMCSTHEGFGMPILEAQATGRVVLTSQCSSMPEVAGAGAYFVDPYSVDSIRAGIKTLCGDADLRHQLIAAGFENIQRFQPERVAQQYIQLYKDVLADS